MTGKVFGMTGRVFGMTGEGVRHDRGEFGMTGSSVFCTTARDAFSLTHCSVSGVAEPNVGENVTSSLSRK